MQSRDHAAVFRPAGSGLCRPERHAIRGIRRLQLAAGQGFLTRQAAHHTADVVVQYPLVPLGPYDISHAPLRYWDLTLYDMYPECTTINGRQVDENLEGYRYCTASWTIPSHGLDMFSDEAGLEAASKRMMTYIIQDIPRDIGKFYAGHSYYVSYYGFVSDGPIVTDWHAANETRITGGKWGCREPKSIVSGSLYTR